jgi:UDP-N-acetylglucosamine--N-acetylmuramyl-(pentapeptide) pyrophosphoryl-undecaprenol N-acetylglucosamine transferase
MSKKINVLIACGGTGGHLFPGIAVAEALEKLGHNVLLLISEKKVDAQASEKYGLLKFITVPAIAKPSTFSLRMIPFLFKLWKSIRQSRKILKEHRCEVVLGMGGFTSLPPVYAGKRMKLATYVHDSNALPGKANRLTARWCSKVLLGFKAAQTYFKTNKVVITGTPVRQELTAAFKPGSARATFKLPSDGKALLVMGGSQGAKKLNSLVVAAAKELQRSYNDETPKETYDLNPDAIPKLRILHITGASDYERIKEGTKNIEGYQVLSFCDDMASAYAACDLALCRAGASSMTELAYTGMPSILVPYPYAADDHQTCNAKLFEKAGAAILRQEAELDTATLVSDLTRIIGDETLSQKMSKQAENLAVKDAAHQICKAITQAS